MLAVTLQDIGNVVWAVLSSPAGIVLVVALLTVLAAVLKKKWPWVAEFWVQNEGTVIQAVRSAEKAIDDDTPDVGMARFDAALRYIITVYESTHGRTPTEAEVESLKQGISIVHERLESAGVLDKGI